MAASRKRPTVIDVARVAGVGASTVSRVLRGVKVQPEMAQQVNDAIERLGYQPDETARALRGGRSRAIGVLIPQIANKFFSDAVQIIENEARKQGCAVILLTHQEQTAQQAERLATMKRYRMDGVILAAAPGTTYKDIHAALPGVPIVTFDRLVSPKIDSVLLHNHDAARIATEHMLRHGYDSVACIAGCSDIYTFRERIIGYTEAMGRFKRAACVMEALTDDQMQYNISAMLMGAQPPASLLSLSNMATRSILQVYEELAIPREKRMPLVAFDDFDFSALVDPPLTVMRQPIDAMVRHALNILFQRIDGQSQLAVQHISLAAELMCRRSCGCS
jgi:LacI family transcriptional regulator